MINKLPDFLIIPYPLLEDKNIGLIDERLDGIIYWFTKLKNEKCIASNKTLAELVKTTPATIQNSLTKLEEKRFILRKFKDPAKKHRTEIIPLVVFSRVSPTSDTDNLVSPTNDTISLTNDTGYHSQMTRRRIYNKKSKEEAETSSAGTLSSEVIKLMEAVDPKNKTYYANKTQRASAEFLVSQYGLGEVSKVIAVLPKTNKIKFFPTITSPYDLKEKWVKLRDELQKKKQELQEKNNKHKVAF